MSVSVKVHKDVEEGIKALRKALIGEGSRRLEKHYTKPSRKKYVRQKKQAHDLKLRSVRHRKIHHRLQQIMPDNERTRVYREQLHEIFADGVQFPKKRKYYGRKYSVK